MGQYYKPVSIEKKEHVESHDFGNGLKLMEHSWIGNNFVSAVENLIKKGGQWYKDHIVWASDYADEEPNSEENMFDLATEKILPSDETDESLRYIVNLDKKEFVDKAKVPVTHTFEDGITMRIHPLPLLTNEGNGGGGGDFMDKDPKNLIGRWARCRVVMRKTRPKTIRGFKEINFDLVESRF